MTFDPRTIGITTLLLALLALTGCEGDGVLSRVPGLSGSDRFLPRTNEVPGLVRISKKRVYRSKDMPAALGPMANLYINYGAESLATADYTYGGADRNLTIEAVTMDQDVAAAGMFHYYRGKKLRNRGLPAEVGVEGILDRDHENRNLYFYKKRQFFKVIYTGPAPVPSLIPIGQKLASYIAGEQSRPKGFAYLNMQGIDASSAHVTPGYTFNCDFLPPGIFANAPVAGPIAEAFLIGHFEKKNAEKTAQDYRTYLELNGTDYTLQYGPSRRRIWWARDPQQGRVICTQYREWIIGVLRPRTYAKGEALLEQLVARIQQDRRR